MQLYQETRPRIRDIDLSAPHSGAPYGRDESVVGFLEGASLAAVLAQAYVTRALSQEPPGRLLRGAVLVFAGPAGPR